MVTVAVLLWSMLCRSLVVLLGVLWLLPGCSDVELSVVFGVSLLLGLGSGWVCGSLVADEVSLCRLRLENELFGLLLASKKRKPCIQYYK